MSSPSLQPLDTSLTPPPPHTPATFPGPSGAGAPEEDLLTPSNSSGKPSWLPGLETLDERGSRGLLLGARSQGAHSLRKTPVLSPDPVRHGGGAVSYLGVEPAGFPALSAAALQEGSPESCWGLLTSGGRGH